VLVEAEEDRRRMLLDRRIVSFRKTGGLYRRDREVHRARLTRPRELARGLREIGFRVRIVRGYGRFSFGRGHVGFVARKDLSSAPDTRANRTSPLQSATSTLGRPLRPTLSATR